MTATEDLNQDRSIAGDFDRGVLRGVAAALSDVPVRDHRRRSETEAQYAERRRMSAATAEEKAWWQWVCDSSPDTTTAGEEADQRAREFANAFRGTTDDYPQPVTLREYLEDS